MPSRTQSQGERKNTKPAAGVLFLAADGCPTLTISVDSAEEASALFQRYRDHYCIGASDMSQDCGNIYSNDGTLVASVSYNGRVWNSEGEILREAITAERVNEGPPR